MKARICRNGAIKTEKEELNMDSIFHRISVRKYEDKMVEKEKILQIL